MIGASDRWAFGLDSAQWLRLARNKPTFNSRWYPYESLMAAETASDQNISHAPVKSYLGMHVRALEKGSQRH